MRLRTFRLPPLHAGDAAHLDPGGGGVRLVVGYGPAPQHRLVERERVGAHGVGHVRVAGAEEAVAHVGEVRVGLAGAGVEVAGADEGVDALAPTPLPRRGEGS